MRDVARLAGVSVKTVSNVVNKFPHVSASTAEKVHAAIDRLGYRMNFSARNLSLGRTGMITLAVPKLSLPYFAELSDDVIEVAEALGHTVLIEQTGGIRERELALLVSDRRRMTDGLVFSPDALREEDAPRLEVDFPLVLLGERRLHSRIDHVSTADVDGARAAAQHLLDVGRRRIALIGSFEPGHTGAGSLRTKGFLLALQAAGLRHDPARTGEVTTWTRAGGAGAMRAVLDRGVEVDAVFALNDLLALGALRMLFECGRSVPDDIAVAGFDDIQEARFGRPSLTTIEPGRSQIARQAVELLLDVGGPPRGDGPRMGQHVTADFSLQVRESTGPAPA
jgi:DNA-binding LacI/PurR family transcriptional regulator